MSNEALAVVPQAQPQISFSAEQQQMIRDSLASGASPAEFAMLMEVARARNLNPITRQIHFVKRWDSMKSKEVWSYQVSIDGLRAIAERTGRYDGQDEPEFESEGKGLKLARVRVYKRGIDRPFVGVAYWSEYVQTKKDGTVTHMWATKPHVMLAKCAEALALRKGFPEDTSGLYTDEEMPEERDVTPRRAPARSVARDGDFDAMVAECEKGFPDWEAKRAWAEANKDRKAALSPAEREIVTEAFKKATPIRKEAAKVATAQPEAVPHDSVTGEVIEDPPENTERLDFGSGTVGGRIVP